MATFTLKFFNMCFSELKTFILTHRHQPRPIRSSIKIFAFPDRLPEICRMWKEIPGSVHVSRTTSILGWDPSKFLLKLVEQFLCNSADKLTNQTTNQETRATLCSEGDNKIKPHKTTSTNPQCEFLLHYYTLSTRIKITMDVPRCVTCVDCMSMW